MHMYNHFENIRNLYGEAFVQIPNNVFAKLSREIRTRNKTNVQQFSFAYGYLVTVSFLYKYTHFVDISNLTYIQNSDIKEVLGYDRTTKTVDKIIKKNGILDELGLFETTKEYPVQVEYAQGDIDNELSMREFVTFNTLDVDDLNYSTIKGIVKNKNYEVKKPLFFFDNEGDVGTLYNYNNTHRVTIIEFLEIIYNSELDNIDFMLYMFFKSKCAGHKDDTFQIPLQRVIGEVGISKDTFYKHLEVLKKRRYLSVNHKGWRQKRNEETGVDSNEYSFKGV